MSFWTISNLDPFISWRIESYPPDIIVCIRRFRINTARVSGVESVPVSQDDLFDKGDNPIDENPLELLLEMFLLSGRIPKCFGHFWFSMIINVSRDLSHKWCHRASSLANSDDFLFPFALDPIALMTRRPTLWTSFEMAWNVMINYVCIRETILYDGWRVGKVDEKIMTKYEDTRFLFWAEDDFEEKWAKEEYKKVERE